MGTSGTVRRSGQSAELTPILAVSLFLAAAASFSSGTMAAPCRGSFQILVDTGISSITVSQSVDGFMYLLDRRDLKNSRIRTPDGDFAHGVEYDIANNVIRPISTVTNTWCSAGAYLADGTIINTAGSNWGGGSGLVAARSLRACSLNFPVPPTRFTGGKVFPCREWYEDVSVLSLSSMRWYPSAQILPDNRIFVIGGSNNNSPAPKGIVPSYEFVDPWKAPMGPSFPCPFLVHAIPNYLYPFVHLLPSNRLFIFANRDGIILDYMMHRVDMLVPQIPNNKSRSYPSTGSSALLPLTPRGRYRGAEVIICGGSSEAAGVHEPADNTCYRMDVSNWSIRKKSLSWQPVEYMKRSRVMPDLVYLLDGTLAIINGLQLGYAGFATGSDPNYWPEIYIPFATHGQRIQSDLCPSSLARGYHSTANLLRDGRLFVSGSNGFPAYHNDPSNPLSTEYRAEAWSPPYLTYTSPRPQIVQVPAGKIGHSQTFQVTFRLNTPTEPWPPLRGKNTAVGLISLSFTTHSQSMNQRYLFLRVLKVFRNHPTYTLTVSAPPNKVVAPSGYHMLTVIFQGNPSIAKWVHIMD